MISTVSRSVAERSTTLGGTWFCCPQLTVRQPRQEHPTSPRIPEIHTKPGTYLEPLTGCQASTLLSGGSTTIGRRMFLTSQDPAALRLRAAIREPLAGWCV